MWGVVIIAKSNKNRTVNFYFQLFICNMFLLFVRYLHRPNCYYGIFISKKKKHSKTFVILIVLRYLCIRYPLAGSLKGKRVGFDFMEMGVYLAPVFDMS